MGLKVKSNKLKAKIFSSIGNYGFGIQKHINFGIKYDPNTSIYDTNFFIVLERKGIKVAKRRRKNACISRLQQVKNKEDSQKYLARQI